MESLREQLFSLLRAGTDPTLPVTSLPEEDLGKIFAMAKTHDLGHLVAAALLRGGEVPKDSPLYKQAAETQLLAVYRTARRDHTLSKIMAALEQEKIPHLPLKGSVLSAYYPEGWMRTSCDIDILVKEEDLSRAAAVLTEKCGCTAQGRSFHDWPFVAENDVHIELHFCIFEDHIFPKANDILHRVWELATPEKEDSARYRMPDELFYFYHIVHMAKHCYNGGCGIRPFLDLWVLCHRVPFDAAARQALLDEGGLALFASKAEHLSEVWFGDGTHDEVTRELEEYILRGGVYGTTENRLAAQTKKNGGRGSYLLSKIFLPYDQMKYYYPVAQKHKWLFPFLQVRRWGRIIFCGGASRSAKEIKQTRALSAETEEKTAKLFSGIGL